MLLSCWPTVPAESRAIPQSDGLFAEALGEVCSDLARQIVADGEGATVVLEIAVSNASSAGEAEAIARRVATSPLVKTAAFGRDPNWGRVLAAAGSAPWNGGFARLDPDALSVSFDGTAVYDVGRADGLVSRHSPARRAGSSSTSGSATARPATWRAISRRTT